MKNLAGDKACDVEIRRELTRCRIPIVEVQRSTGEVPSSLIGYIGPLVFRRDWYYWVVTGEVPLPVAQELYEDPVGRSDIRVDGHCGCPAPEGCRVKRYDSDGNQLVLDKTGEDLKQYVYMVEHGFIPSAWIHKYHWVSFESDLVRLTARAVVDLYHIDTEIGLRLFADTIRKHGIGEKESA